MMFARYLQKIQLLKDSEVSVIKYVLLFLLIVVNGVCNTAHGMQIARGQGENVWLMIGATAAMAGIMWIE